MCTLRSLCLRFIGLTRVNKFCFQSLLVANRLVASVVEFITDCHSQQVDRVARVDDAKGTKQRNVNKQTAIKIKRNIVDSINSVAMHCGACKWKIETDKRVAPPIMFVYWIGLQNLKRHMCCRAIKTKLIGVVVNAYQCPLVRPLESCLHICINSKTHRHLKK